MTKSDGALLGAVLVGVIGIGALFLFAPDAPRGGYVPVEVTGSVLTATSSAPYRVDAWVTLKEPGFVTIHESIGGAPGPILGTSMYLETTTVVSSIAIDPPLTPGTPYIALLHVDNGDKTFVMNDDLPVMSGGQIVRADFTSTDTPSGDTEGSP